MKTAEIKIEMRIRHCAKALGFDPVGFTRLGSLEEGEENLRRWVKEGRHGGMTYLEKYEERKKAFLKNFPDARSIIVLGVNYYSSEIASSPPRIVAGPRNDGEGELHRHCEGAERPTQPPLRGRVARYAWGQDYHHVLARKHEQLIAELIAVAGPQTKAQSCVDTRPVPERYAAVRAGFGFFGKNTMVLNQKYGPWLFLSEIVTNLELEETLEIDQDCGTCSRCQAVCPTGALDQDYRMDARKCIAYLTIEHKGSIPKEYRPLIKDWIFGCDECLTVCPFTSRQWEAVLPELRPEAGKGAWLAMDELFSLTSNRLYEKAFEASAMNRAGRKQMLRNACVVLGNSGRKEALPYLARGLEDPAPLVREHAAWALGRLGFPEARRMLQAALSRETHPEVTQELTEALERTP